MDTEYRILSIRQPWASLIVSGAKTIENRKWSTLYRGALLIHAGLTSVDLPAVEAYCKRRGIRLPDTYETGGIVGVCDLVDVVTESDNPWFRGPYGFVLKRAKVLPFIPCPGQLRLFYPDAELLAKLKARLPSKSK